MWGNQSRTNEHSTQKGHNQDSDHRPDYEVMLLTTAALCRPILELVSMSRHSLSSVWLLFLMWTLYDRFYSVLLLHCPHDPSKTCRCLSLREQTSHDGVEVLLELCHHNPIKKSTETSHVEFSVSNLCLTTILFYFTHTGGSKFSHYRYKSRSLCNLKYFHLSVYFMI